MRNSSSPYEEGIILHSREEIEDIIKKHWSNLLGCETSNFSNGLTYVVDSKNPRLPNTKKRKEEIQVLQLKNGGTIINIGDECYEEAKEIINTFGIDKERLGQLLQKKYKGQLLSYDSIRSYIFNKTKLLPLNPHVHKLEKPQKHLYAAFMEKCSEYEKEHVYMDFDASFHNFYAYFENGIITAIGEFCKLYDDDIIVIPSIITREDCRGKGYGKAVVNTMTHAMLNQGFVPQYRCDPNNTGSRALAKSLGYEEMIDGFSLRIIITEF